MDTNRINRENYVDTLIPLTDEESRYRCLRFLTQDNDHREMCHNTYNETHLLAFIQNSTHFLYYREKDTKQMVGFTLLKVRKHILEILLLCAIPNEKTFGTMVAFGAYNIALRKRCEKIYVAPRTRELRTTFIRHGYTTLYGTEDIDEVFEKPVRVNTYIKTNTTRKMSHSAEKQTRRNVRNTVIRPYTLKKRTTYNINQYD